MRVFMSGATGLVGGAVAKALHARQHTVVTLVRNAADAERMQSLGYRPVIGDATLPGAWLDEAKQAEALIHLAFSRSGKRLDRRWAQKAGELDRLAFQAMIEAAEEGRCCKALCYTSGNSVFGDHGERWIDEATAVAPGTIGSIKHAGEIMATRAFQRGLPAFVLRPGLVYASSGIFAEHFLAPAAQGKLRYVGGGKAYHATVHIDDLASAYALAIENPPAGEVLSIVDDDPQRWREMTGMLLAAFGKPASAKGAPAWLVALFAGKPLVEILTHSYRVRNQKAKDRLGWQLRYPTLRDGIASVVADFRAASEASSGSMLSNAPTVAAR